MARPRSSSTACATTAPGTPSRSSRRSRLPACTPETTPDMAAADFVKALQGTDEIELTVTGRVSCKKSTRPVWAVLEGKTLDLLPAQGSDSEGYKNVLKHPTGTLAAEGATGTGKAAPIT